MKYYIERLRDLRERGISIPDRFISTLFTDDSDPNYYSNMFVIVIEFCGEIRLLNELFPSKVLASQFAEALLSEDLGWKKGEE